MMRLLVVPVALGLVFAMGFARAQGHLEIPGPNSVQSGIGVVSGWHCTARRIEVSIDGGPPFLAGSGTERLDTAGVCGHANTGFSFLFNWNLLPKNCFGCRFHRVEAMADGVPFASATFQVEHFGVEFMTGKSASYSLPNFPEPGSGTTLRWDEERQNFAIYLTAPRLVEASGTYFGALRTGAQNPVCGPFPQNRVLPIRHGSFTVATQDGQVSLSVQYADGGACQLGPSGREATDSRTSDGFVHALFDGVATAACPEFPGGLDIRFNGERLVADSRDNCRTAHVMAAK